MYACTEVLYINLPLSMYTGKYLFCVYAGIYYTHIHVHVGFCFVHVHVDANERLSAKGREEFLLTLRRQLVAAAEHPAPSLLATLPGSVLPSEAMLFHSLADLEGLANQGYGAFGGDPHPTRLSLTIVKRAKDPDFGQEP